MITEFIYPGEQQWNELLGRTVHDVYHLPEYSELCARHEGGMPVAFYAANNDTMFLAPLLIRELPDWLDAPENWCDVVTPYGYPAPILNPSDSGESLITFLESFRQVAASWGIVTAFFRFHPLLPLPLEHLAEYGQLIRHGQTVAIDLTTSQEALWSQIRNNHRRDIRRLLEAGYYGEIDCWSYYDDFIAIYQQTMNRLQADAYYYFGKEYFDELLTCLGPHLHLCTILSPEGSVAAAGLFTVVDGIVQYHLGATSDDYTHCAPSKLMIAHAINWAQESGYQILHLGGGVGCRSDSLFHFKTGFSKQLHDFYTYRMVIDQQKYGELNRRWCARQAYQQMGNDFFPEYRCPVEEQLLEGMS